MFFIDPSLKSRPRQMCIQSLFVLVFPVGKQCISAFRIFNLLALKDHRSGTHKLFRLGSTNNVNCVLVNIEIWITFCMLISRRK